MAVWSLVLEQGIRGSAPEGEQLSIQDEPGSREGRK